MKDKTFTVSMQHDEFVALRKLCFLAGCSVPKFVQGLLHRFLLDPETFISVLEKNYGTDVPGADDLSE